MAWSLPPVQQLPEFQGNAQQKKRFILNDFGRYVDDYNKEFLKINDFKVNFQIISTYEKQTLIAETSKFPDAFFEKPTQEIVQFGHNALNDIAKARTELPTKQSYFELYRKANEFEKGFEGLEEASSRLAELEKSSQQLAQHEAKATKSLWILLVAIVGFIVFARLSTKKI